MAVKKCTRCGKGTVYRNARIGNLCKACRLLSEPVKSHKVCWLEKPCCKCNETKPLAQFALDKTKKDGRRGVCKLCSRKNHKSDKRRCPHGVTKPRNRLLDSWYDARSGGHTLSLEEYAEHYERVKMGCPQSSWKCWHARPERTPVRCAIRERATRIQRPLNNPDTGRRVWPKGWSKADQYKWKYHNDKTYMLWERQRNQFKKWLKGERSTNSLARSVDYSRGELLRHIEQQFSKGMSWNNYGKWHIDHIKPKNLFNPADKDEVRTCWALSNLRPLWAYENIRRPKDGADILL